MNKKILIIEDDQVVRENITLLLSEEEYIVFSADNGADGIRIAKQEQPDLIICDIMMYGFDGYEVLKNLSADPKTSSIPFIFLTAKVEKEDIRAGLKLGADDYLFKPFDSEDLLNSIKNRLKRLETLRSNTETVTKNSEKANLSIEDKLFIQVNKQAFFINISDITSVLAERQYSSLQLSDKKTYLVRKSITHWENVLPEKKFLRINRSTLINIDYIDKMEKWFNSSYILYLKNIEKPLMISKRYSVKLREKLIK